MAPKAANEQFAPLLPRLLFANSLNDAGNSLVGNHYLITKVYFPRLVIPIASVVTGLIDFVIAPGHALADDGLVWLPRRTSDSGEAALAEMMPWSTVPE